MNPHDTNKGHDGTEWATPPVLQFDPAKYAAEIDLFDMTDAQKQELLLTLWSIMRSFVELGFTVDVCAALQGDTPPVTCDGDVS